MTSATSFSSQGYRRSAVRVTDHSGRLSEMADALGSPGPLESLQRVLDVCGQYATFPYITSILMFPDPVLGHPGTVYVFAPSQITAIHCTFFAPYWGLKGSCLSAPKDQIGKYRLISYSLTHSTAQRKKFGICQHKRTECLSFHEPLWHVALNAAKTISCSRCAEPLVWMCHLTCSSFSVVLSPLSVLIK